MSILEFELDALEMDNIGSWPLWVRILSIALACISIGWLGYYYDIQKEWAHYVQLKGDRKEQQDIFVQKHSQMKQLDVYKEQMHTIQERMDTLKRELPSSKEEASFLETLSQQASAFGLNFLAIKPSPEEDKGFYTECPLELKLSGLYHGIGMFISEVAGMPRMVTFHDFKLKLSKPEMNFAKVELTLVAKIYWVQN